jgi:protein ImuA
MTTEKTHPAESFPADCRAVVIQKLRTELGHLRRGQRQAVRANGIVSTGIAVLDDILPDRGLLRGTLSEWIAAEHGSGSLTLVLRAASQAQCDGPLIVVDGLRRLYAPAMKAAGVSLEETILVRPKSRTDGLWAVEQSLKCPGVGAVLFPVDDLKTQDFRRLQLAAESGTAIGILVRSMSAQKQRGWADLRMLVSPIPSPARLFCRRLEVRCLHAKGTLTDKTVELDVCDETGAVCLAARLSDPTDTSSTTKAQVDSVCAVSGVGQSSAGRHGVE